MGVTERGGGSASGSGSGSGSGYIHTIDSESKQDQGYGDDDDGNDADDDVEDDVLTRSCDSSHPGSGCMEWECEWEYMHEEGVAE